MMESDERRALSAMMEQGSLLPIDRKRLSAPGIRTFLAIADQWLLTEDQRRKVLGSPAPSTYRRWRREASNGLSFSLSLDVLARLSNLLGIHAALSQLFTEQRLAVEWMHSPHAAPPFDGQSPLDLMTTGHLDGLMATRRFLAAAQQGLYVLPNAIDVDSTPYTEEEIQIR
ncbi:MbcA/ParS/Xre antitoxin family protein [Novosphingobium sp. JCM 18896]|uniref:MbcA/ParS/Xre antitoxin family protein n=1 Tax=Novosphingobium sp. JCM 18896 TaxID=2989731 RepID=UPI00222184FB|nr:MbcA/ParS/Xre antitoxin family protein [Novosphingobium sp. JCM 18896]MCW1429511.1 MbcA/ParS/Xre antitoxin family protein [Novosphingobium sp. JCM 18896]